MKIRGFWHILMINKWVNIIADQLNALLESDLYDTCEEISIGCIGHADEKKKLEQILSNYPKIHIKAYSEVMEEYEFLTLRLIEKDPSQYIGFYFHTKGVTRPRDEMQTKERNFLNEIMLNQWRTHRYIIETGYDISSVNYLTIPNRFSGNYFWFSRERFNKLPRIDTLDVTDRFQAEKLIYMSK